MKKEFSERILQQAFDIWINPELEKRKENGRIPDNFILWGAQIIFSGDRNFNKVRINDEIKVVIEAKDTKPIINGENFFIRDIDEINSVKLTNKDPNCGHITLLHFNNQWIISFDSRYNKKRIKQHIQVAKEFLESAKNNFSNNRLHPFFEVSFACAELAAKAILLHIPNKEILHGKNHNTRIKRFENWAELGNVDIKFSKTLKRLFKLRPSARYLCSTEYKNEDTNDIILTLENMIDFAESSIE